MIGIKRILFALLLFIAGGQFAGGPLYAQLPGAPLNVPATLEAESTMPAAGQRVTLAFHFKPKPTWHGYWENPGDAGFGMQLKWELPKGVSVGALHYPVPEPLIISGLMNHVYEREYAVLVDVDIDKALPVGTRLPIKVRGDWLACTREICVPEGDGLGIDLVVGDGRVNTADQTRFDTWRAGLPLMMDQNALYAIKGNVIDIAIPFAQGAVIDRPYFFAKTEQLFRYAAPQTARRTGNWLVISGQVNKAFYGPVEGVLRIGEGQGLWVLAKPGIIPTGGDVVQILGQNSQIEKPDSGVNLYGILGFFGLSVLGGLILNLMPCVFPILGLKALALAKMGGDERGAKVDALAYAAGVILSCIALGGVMLALRAGGQQIGWAFQLQEPAVVLLLVLLMVAVTANLAGLFELSAINAGDSLTRQGGVMGSFWTGVLAAVVATPCTGPFMAAAMGAALLLPVLPALLLFAGLGLGLALPFLILTYVPELRRRMPKPGPWLEKFRRAMAVPMGLTAVALLWLLWRLLGDKALLVGLVSSALLIFGLWSFGKGQRTGKPMFRMPVLAFIAFLLYIIARAGLDYLPNPEIGRKAAPDLLRSEAFSEKLLDQYRGEGRRVFVYFTADWCVTCKVNEAAAIEREDTKRAFAGNAINVLKGDFTRRDPAISRFLAQHGRSGVPLYLYYPKGGEAQILPQVLTGNTLISLK
jgi:DsbC/DsbD-like thiol-disulfide interchange protein/cytochrome c biogenesis protein CcdA